LNDSGAVSGRERKASGAATLAAARLALGERFESSPLATPEKTSQVRAGLRPGGLGKGKTHACAFARAERLKSLAVRPDRATPKQSPKRKAGRDAPHIGQNQQ